MQFTTGLYEVFVAMSYVAAAGVAHDESPVKHLIHLKNT